MKIEIRKLLIIGGVLAAAGIVLSGLGFLFGGSTMLYVDSRGLHAGNSEKKQLEYQQISGSIENLIIELSTSDLEIIPSDENAIEAVYRGDQMKPVVKQDGNKISIMAEAKAESRFPVVSFGMGIINESKVKLYLDKKTMLQTMKIKVDCGHIALQESIKIKNLEIENHLGDLTLSGIEADDISLKLNSGKSTLENINCKNFVSVHNLGDLRAKGLIAQSGNIRSNSGSTVLNDSSLDQIIIESDLGEIEGYNLTLKGGDIISRSGHTNLQGNISGVLNIKSNLGDVSINTDKPKKDFYCKLKTSLGDVRLNGENMEGSLQEGNDSAANRITVQNDSGNIEVNFGN